MVFRSIPHKNSRVVESEHLTLDEWLALLKKPPKRTLFVDYQFPTDQHREEYLTNAHAKTDEEVLLILRKFLIPSMNLGIDARIWEYFIETARTAPETYKHLERTEFIRRLFRSMGGKHQTWEGITWLIDLLPESPGKALEILNSYLMVHAQWLPEGRFNGLTDAAALIRAKYIGSMEQASNKQNLLLSLTPRQFECIVERLYDAMAFTTQLTAPQSDGGRDIIARSHAAARKHDLRVECKRYSKPVGVEYARRLLGVVSSEKVAKGVLVSTASFTRGARAFAELNPRIELVEGRQLVMLLNEHLGSNWPVRVERLVAESLRVTATGAPPNSVLQLTGGSAARS